MLLTKSIFCQTNKFYFEKKKVNFFFRILSTFRKKFGLIILCVFLLQGHQRLLQIHLSHYLDDSSRPFFSKTVIVGQVRKTKNFCSDNLAVNSPQIALDYLKSEYLKKTAWARQRMYDILHFDTF